jgi:hypothetical protein
MRFRIHRHLPPWVKDRYHAGLGVEIFAIRADDMNGLSAALNRMS